MSLPSDYSHDSHSSQAESDFLMSKIPTICQIRGPCYLMPWQLLPAKKRANVDQVRFVYTVHDKRTGIKIFTDVTGTIYCVSHEKPEEEVVKKPPRANKKSARGSSGGSSSTTSVPAARVAKQKPAGPVAKPKGTVLPSPKYMDYVPSAKVSQLCNKGPVLSFASNISYVRKMKKVDPAKYGPILAVISPEDRMAKVQKQLSHIQAQQKAHPDRSYNNKIRQLGEKIKELRVQGQKDLIVAKQKQLDHFSNFLTKWAMKASVSYLDAIHICCASKHPETAMIGRELLRRIRQVEPKYYSSSSSSSSCKTCDILSATSAGSLHVQRLAKENEVLRAELEAIIGYQ